MKKYRINLTVQDYYDYVGTRPFISTRDRMLASIPSEFEKGYNIKFKVIKHPRSWGFSKFYRVHLSLITTEETIQKVIKGYKSTMFLCNNITYKEIKLWRE